MSTRSGCELSTHVLFLVTDNLRRVSPMVDQLDAQEELEAHTPLTRSPFTRSLPLPARLGYSTNVEGVSLMYDANSDPTVSDSNKPSNVGRGSTVTHAYRIRDSNETCHQKLARIDLADTETHGCGTE